MATLAEPILASTLWSAHKSTEQAAATHSQPRRLPTQHRIIDKALQSGLDYGSMTCISGEPDTGTIELCQALLISQLSSSPTATATIVDTGVSLDIRKLHQALTAKIGDAAQATKALDRIKIMRVFDFVGLTECIAEVRSGMEGRHPPPPRGTIEDSQSTPSEEPLEDRSGTQSAPRPVLDTASSDKAAQKHLLIITSITNPTSPLLKSNYASGQALLSSFMRSLSHLTKAHNICAVLANSVVNNANEESPSIFSSCDLQPALGRALGYSVDLHLMVHELGRARGSEERCSVVEVLSDRHAGRVGRWTGFVVDEDTGKLVEVA